MIKIIETNISLNENDEIMDHQARVVEVESWQEFIEEAKNHKSISRVSLIGVCHGLSFPLSGKIENLKYNDHTLSCNITLWNGLKTKKLVYKV
jgi:hypothetical protein